MARLFVTASEDKTAHVWNAASPKDSKVLSGHEYNVKSAALSPDGARVVSALMDGTARIWDVASGKEVALKSHEERNLFSSRGTR